MTRYAHDRSDWPTIRIEYCARRNARKGADGKPLGWVPLIFVNGECRGDTWRAEGLDFDAALDAAKVDADREASHYAGDWNLSVAERIDSGNGLGVGTSGRDR